MNSLGVCALPIYEFRLENAGLIDRVLGEVKNLSYQANAENLVSRDQYYEPELFQWFDQCLAEIRDRYFNANLELVISRAWANRTERLRAHHRHCHPNSWVSGVFYLSTHQSGAIEFLRENPWTEQFVNRRPQNMDHRLVVTMLRHELTEQILPLKGRLLLFPSSLQHRVLGLTARELEDRYSISFNAFPQGTLDLVGSPHSSTGLDLRVISVKEQWQLGQIPRP